MTKLQITDTILRDSHQSLAATRMRYDQMEPVLEDLDKVGYYSLEMWGGATFDSCLRFLNEDPWERLRKVRDKVKNTKLQMLLRGQNILGYKHYPDDVVEYFVQKTIANGIDILRIFDALNDVRNMQSAIDATKKEGGHVEATVCYTISPVHDTQYFVNLAKELENHGADTICIKDMAGLLIPYTAYDLIKALKEEIKVPIHLHTHCTSGVAQMTYWKAIQAGVDIVDTAISPFAEGTSQPATEPLVKTLQGTKRDTGFDLNLLSKIADHFKKIRQEFIDAGTINPRVLGVDINTLMYQVPGGMFSNLVSQLTKQNALDKLDDVLKEIPNVRKDFGYPPLVTPSSQIVGTQAVLNVLTGERYKMITNESKALVRGEYGKTAVEISDEVKKTIIGDEKVITQRPADFIEPGLDKFKEEIKEYIKQDEDVLSYALFPDVAMKFFENRKKDNK